MYKTKVVKLTGPVKLTWPVLSFQYRALVLEEVREAGGGAHAASSSQPRTQGLVVTAAHTRPCRRGREKLERETSGSSAGEGGGGGQASGRCHEGRRPAQAPSGGHAGMEVARRGGDDAEEKDH
jgi:hypothetical protein